jgi:hypothetical protein
MCARHAPQFDAAHRTARDASAIAARQHFFPACKRLQALAFLDATLQ